MINLRCRILLITLVIAVCVIGAMVVVAVSYSVPPTLCDEDIIGFSESTPRNCSIKRLGPPGNGVDLNLSIAETREALRDTLLSLTPVTSVGVGELERPDFHFVIQVGMDPVQIWVQNDHDELHFSVSNDDHLYQGGSVREFVIGIEKLLGSSGASSYDNFMPVPGRRK